MQLGTDYIYFCKGTSEHMKISIFDRLLDMVIYIYIDVYNVCCGEYLLAWPWGFYYVRYCSARNENLNLPVRIKFLNKFLCSSK